MFKKILGLFSVLVIISFVSALNYEFQVKLTDQKNENLTGTLKAYVHANDTEEFFRLNQTTLVPNGNYTSKVDCKYQSYQISNVTFQWTLVSPYPPKYLISKPVIYLKELKLVPIYIQNPYFRMTETKLYCPKEKGVGLKHKDKMLLVEC